MGLGNALQLSATGKERSSLWWHETRSAQTFMSTLKVNLCHVTHVQNGLYFCVKQLTCMAAILHVLVFVSKLNIDDVHNDICVGLTVNIQFFPLTVGKVASGKERSGEVCHQ